MGTSLVFKRTIDLSASQQDQIRQVFFRVFSRKMGKSFEQRFICTPKGYSYHGIMLNDDQIVGCFSAIPYRYLCFGKEQTFALSVDTMIAPEHRGGKTNLLTMANLVYEALVKDDIKFIYGFPNELYYPHEKRLFGTRDIGMLDYYVLPINIGTAINKFKMLDYPGRLFARIMGGLPPCRDTNKCKYNIEKINDAQFIKHRYGNTHKYLSLDGGAQCVYSIHIEKENVRTLHILDVWPMAPAAMDSAVRELFKLHRDSIDLILYVGSLPFRPRRLVKVPRQLEPQKIRMTAKMLVEGAFPDSIFKIENWNVNVSNFDVR
jgi:hypothetical protein